MKKYKKLIKFSFLVILSFGIALLIVGIISNALYRNQIPSLPDFTSMSVPIKEQLTIADRKARHNTTADNIGMLGMDYHSCAYYDQAATCYKLAISKNKSRWIYSYYLGYLNQEMGDSKSALENFKNVIRENSKVYQAWYYIGKAYQNLESDSLAELAFKKIAFIKDNTSDFNTVRVNYSSFQISAKFELARIYLNTKRLDNAEKILTDVIKTNHTIGPVYRLLGNVYSAKGNLMLSKKYIIRAHDLATVSPFVDTLADRLTLISRSELYLPKQIDNAINSANPDWAQRLINHALQYLSEDKYLISKVIKFYLQSDAGKESLPYLGKNFNEFRDNYTEMMEVGYLLYSEGFYSQALPYLSQAKKLKPENNDYQSIFALCCWNAGKKDTALTMMKELYSKNKGNAKLLADNVDFMIKVGEKEMAESYLAKLRQVAPGNPKVYKLTGIIAESEGNRKLALSMFRTAFKCDTGDLETVQKLSDILVEQKDWAEAVTLLRSSLESHPNKAALLVRLGSLLVACPDPKERNVSEGLELSERAFFHLYNPINIIISAGKYLAQANAMLGDFQSANFYIGITLTLAQNANMPQDYIKDLISLTRKIKYFSEKK